MVTRCVFSIYKEEKEKRRKTCVERGPYVSGRARAWARPHGPNNGAAGIFARRHSPVILPPSLYRRALTGPFRFANAIASTVEGLELSQGLGLFYLITGFLVRFLVSLPLYKQHPPLASTSSMPFGSEDPLDLIFCLLVLRLGGKWRGLLVPNRLGRKGIYCCPS